MLNTTLALYLIQKKIKSKLYCLIRKCTEQRELVVMPGESCSLFHLFVWVVVCFFFFPRGKNLEENKSIRRHEMCWKQSTKLWMGVKTFHSVTKPWKRSERSSRSAVGAEKPGGSGSLTAPSLLMFPNILSWALSSCGLLQQCSCSFPSTAVLSWWFSNKYL